VPKTGRLRSRDPLYWGLKRKEALLPTQSSAVMALRVMVMLGCLVLIPLVAMLGDALLDGTSRFRESWWVNTATAARDHPGEPAVPGQPCSATDPADHGDVSALENTRNVTTRRGQTPSDRDELAEAEQRLRQLGASHYRLEHWGEDGQWFRFQCRVPISGNPGCAKHFEATDRAPVQAVAVVLRSVETWLKTQELVR